MKYRSTLQICKDIKWTKFCKVSLNISSGKYNCVIKDIYYSARSQTVVRRKEPVNKGDNKILQNN